MIHDKQGQNYPQVVQDTLEFIINEGREVSPRGQLTKEVLGKTLAINSLESLYASPLRNLNFSFLFAENLWYLSGRNALGFLKCYNKNYSNFADQGILQGAYGPQILEQIRYVINTLSEDVDSRQAVISLWRPNPLSAKDKPCTLSFHFMVREGKLNAHVTMRSNDAVWGQNYDVPSFSLLLIVIAGILNIEPGILFLTANSLHVYEKHFDLMDKLYDENFQFKQEHTLIPCKVNSLEHHMECVEECLRAHYLIQSKQYFDIEGFDDLPDFYKQYVGAMAFYVANKEKDKIGVKESIKFLESAKSPLSTILHDKSFLCESK
jgi:thymidylate synthase